MDHFKIHRLVSSLNSTLAVFVTESIIATSESKKMPSAIFLSFASSTLLVLSFPKFDLGFLAWIALVPILAALKDKSLKWAFGLSFLTGITFMMGVFYWINFIDGFNWTHFVLLGIYFGCYFGCFGLSTNIITRNAGPFFPLSAAALWVSFEYLRSHAGFLALPWALLGHSQYLNGTVIQIASLTGVYGVSFLIVMVNAVLSEAFHSRSQKGERTVFPRRAGFIYSALIAVSLVGASLIYGSTVTSTAPANNATLLTVIQGNIPQHIRWERDHLRSNLERHIRLTRDAAANNRNTSLIIWPETSVQGSLTHDLSLLTALSGLAKEINVSLLVGSAVHPKFGSREFRQSHWVNSAFLFSSSGRLSGKYDKIRLLPFAEYLPHADAVPWPAELVSRASHYIPGKEYKIFNIDDVKFGVAICWESIFPDHFRRFVLAGAQIMLNITNEAWFGETAAPYQFLSMNVFRAVENRVPVIRAANTGVSAFIDSNGKIFGKVQRGGKDIFVEGYLTVPVAASVAPSFYTRFGDVFAWLCVAVSLALLLRPFLPMVPSFGRGIS